MISTDESGSIFYFANLQSGIEKIIGIAFGLVDTRSVLYNTTDVLVLVLVELSVIGVGYCTIPIPIPT
jgi:hypothetical protein